MDFGVGIMCVCGVLVCGLGFDHVGVCDMGCAMWGVCGVWC